MPRLFTILLFLPMISFSQSVEFLAMCLKNDTLVNGQVLIPVFQRLEKTKKAGSKEMVRIVQMGDSHVQMGYFAGGIRDGLATEFSVGGTGFWAPLTECGGWGPESVHFSSEGNWSCDKMVNSDDGVAFGLSGFAYVLQPGSGTLTFGNKGKEKITKIEVLHEWNDEWCFQADSAKIHTKKIGGHSAVTTITFKKGGRKAQLRMCGEKARLALRTFAFRVNNPDELRGIDFQYYGAGGAKYSDWSNNASYFQEELEFIDPDLLIISLGTNDAHVLHLVDTAYFQLVDQFVGQLRKHHHKMTILLTSQPDTEYKGIKAPNFNLVNATLRSVAAKYNCAFWDLSVAMGGTNSIRSWDQEGLADKDQMHFTREGYALQGKLLVYAMEQCMKDAGVFVPLKGLEF